MDRAVAQRPRPGVGRRLAGAEIDDWSLRHGCRLWIVRLDDLAPGVQLGAVLSPRERLRASRVLDAGRRERYVRGRAALRALLGAALGVRAAAVELSEGDAGKPRLACEAGLSFNVSHSGSLALIGLTRIGAIGVDIQTARAPRTARGLARRCFHRVEARTLCSLPPPLQADAFLRCWTVKEAVVKALGVGLAERLDRVVVEADPRVPLRLREVPGQVRASRWSVYELAVDGARLAIALPSPDVAIAGVSELDWGAVVGA